MRDKKDAWSILLSLVGCCLGNCCIEEFYDEYGGASPDVVLKFTGESVERMTRFCNILLRESARMAKRARLFYDSIFVLIIPTSSTPGGLWSTR